MNRNKSTFVMRKEWSPLILALSREEAGKLIKAVYLYQTDKQTPLLNKNVDAIFEMMKIEFSNDNKEQTWQIRDFTG